MSSNVAVKTKKSRQPLIQIEKRGGLVWYKAWIIRAVAILSALVLCGILAIVALKCNPFDFYFQVFDGAFGSDTRTWITLRDTAVLLGFAVAIVPAFKMKFWNLGANGQVLISCLATTAVMFYFNGKMPLPALIPLMLLAAILAGVIWAAIPAIFKAKWNTNESLFTLMMNYIAEGVVAYFLAVWVPKGTGELSPIYSAKVPEVINPYFLVVAIVLLLAAFMYAYLYYSKHGYEVSVVGESENTARYVGINVKKVVVRTLILTGVICGIMGFLISGAIDGTVSTQTVENRGFTAIMVTWLAGFNPLFMILTSFFVVFFERGVGQAKTYFGLTNDAFADIVIGIIFLFVIGCEFFINYKITFRRLKKEVK